GGDDRMFWPHSSSGEFTVASAYPLFDCGFHPLKLAIWKQLWAWPGPERIRMFLWLAFKEKILCNWRRVQRHLVDSARCEVCHDPCETVLHVLRDCPSAKAVWRSLLQPHDHLQFFSGDLHSWMEANMMTGFHSRAGF
ncbi:MAG: hypothetical protein Q8807_04130, partial ['Waltheria sp.' little leaf phytoplasma]|nr:hypothetical protein ['Waltheria sp.' little leaf phytoplasma]